MIGRKSKQQPVIDEDVPRSFDDFEMRLGDVMRGERATLGKSLLDVQREIRIKAAYIAAIENCDPSAFDTPGFIAGYVRSYARYLSMDPDETFAVFCAESGFSTAHGMSDQASGAKPGKAQPIAGPQTGADPFRQPAISFAPASDSVLSRIEPGAIGSGLVLIALIAGIGYGGWTVLQEIQRVRLTPVDQTPVVLSDLDPVETALSAANPDDSTPDAAGAEAAGVFTPPSSEALDRLYRPQALDVPVLVARDAPISTLDPSRLGVFASQDTRSLPDMPATGGVPQGGSDGIQTALAEALGGAAGAETADGAATGPQVLQTPGAGVTMIAVRPAWVRVRAADGSVIYETIMNAGDTFAVPQTDEPATLRVGESGAIYFAMDGTTYGPVGPAGSVTSNLALSADALSETYAVAELSSDTDLARVVAELNTPLAEPRPGGAAPADN